MKVKIFDFEGNKFVNKSDSYTRGIIRITDKYIEYGYFKSNPLNRLVLIAGDVKECHNTVDSKYLIFNNIEGYYIIKHNISSSDIIKFTRKKGCGNYPYIINREYEAEINMNLFKDKFKILNNKSYIDESVLKYSFGLEFETSQGYVPQELCFRDGLIPLRDGSISGVEYSTIVLKGNEGLSLLSQQIETLKKYTDFNKECSLHIHFGGYPVTEKHIFTLNNVFVFVQRDLLNYIPKFSFMTDRYKANGKSYCKPVSLYSTFNSLYYAITGRAYLGSLVQPHPCDVAKKAKWNIKSRYMNLNLVNMMCYKSPKTVEFRFLRPTYSFEKIYTWILILNAILKYAEKIADSLTDCKIPDNVDYFTRISDIITDVYSKELADYILDNLIKMSVVIYNQNINGDFCGSNISIEEQLFK